MLFGNVVVVPKVARIVDIDGLIQLEWYYLLKVIILFLKSYSNHEYSVVDGIETVKNIKIMLMILLVVVIAVAANILVLNSVLR